MRFGKKRRRRRRLRRDLLIIIIVIIISCTTQSRARGFLSARLGLSPPPVAAAAFDSALRRSPRRHDLDGWFRFGKPSTQTVLCARGSRARSSLT